MDRRFVIAGGVVGGALVLGLAALLVVPALLKDRLAERFERTLDEAMLADVSLGHVRVGLLRTFPVLTLQVDDLAITGEGEWDGVALLRASRLDLGLDLWSVLFSDVVDVRRLALVAPRFDVRVAADGSSNLDLFPEEDVAAGAEVDTGPFALDLDDVEITDLELRYADRATDVDVILLDLDVMLAGTVTNTGTRVALDATAASLTAAAGGITWLRETEWVADVGLAYDEASGAIQLLENTVSVNALTVSFEGTITPQGPDTALQLALVAHDATFPALLSLVPDAYSDNFAGVDAQGTVSLAGTIDGVLPAEGDALPGFDLEVQVADGRFRYPDVPVGVDRVGLDMRITHPQGPADLIEIAIRRFTLACAGSEITGAGTLANPLTDPRVTLAAKGAVDLEKLGQAFPGATGQSTGSVRMDLKIRGRASDFQAARVDQIEATGRFGATGVVYRDPDLPVAITVQALDLGLAGARARLDRMDLRWPGGSDLAITGTFDQFLPYFIATDGALVGRLAMKGERVDLRPWAADTAGNDGAPAEEDAGLVVPVPANLDLVVGLDFGTLATDAFEMSHVTGTMIVKDEAIALQGLKGQMLGGDVVIDGRYAASTYADAEIDFGIRTVKFDLARTVSQFETLRRIAPILEGAVGRFDSDLSLSTRILADGSPMFATLSSDGLLRTAGMVLQPVVLKGVADQVGQADASNLNLKASQLGFQIRQGLLELKPFDAALGAFKTRIGGTASLIGERLDFTMDTAVPAAGLQKAAGGAALLKPLEGRLPSVVDIQIRITGTYADPQVRLGLKDGDTLLGAAKGAVADAAAQLGGQVLAGGLDAARRQGDAIVAEAGRRAAALRAEGKAAADKVRAEGKARGEKLVAEAKGNPVKVTAAKEAAKSIEKESNRSAKRIEDESNAAANKLVAESEAQRDQLLAEASAAAGSP